MKPPLLPRLLLRVGALLAPRDRRRDLARRWAAEMTHRWRETVHRRWAGLRLALWATGIFRHALDLRRRRSTMDAVDAVVVDVRQALRALRRRPGTALLSVLLLALGIGAASAVSSLVASIFLRPLPFPEGHHLVRVFGENPRSGLERSPVSWLDFDDYRRSSALESAAVYTPAVTDLSGEGRAERIRVAVVGPGFFETLRAEALRGRLLAEADHAEGADRVAVLSPSLWRGRYGSDPDILGSTVRLDGDAYTVVGILRADHAWPLDSRAWISFRWGSSPPETTARRTNHAFQMVGRLADGVDAGTATRRLSEVSLAARTPTPSDPESWFQAKAIPLHQSVHSAEVGRLVLLGGC